MTLCKGELECSFKVLVRQALYTQFGYAHMPGFLDIDKLIEYRLPEDMTAYLMNPVAPQRKSPLPATVLRFQASRY